MLAERKFNIVMVTKDKGVSIEQGLNEGKSIAYNGKKVTVKL